MFWSGAIHMERQNLSCVYIAHHELESFYTIIIIIIINIVIIIIITIIIIIIIIAVVTVMTMIYYDSYHY